MCECEGMVPESRLLAAEARVREVEAERDARRERKVALLECEEREAALRADLAALVPLAAYGYNDLEMDCPSGPWPLVPNDEERAAARAVLARHQEGV